MIYSCDNCGFLFSRTGEVTECPSCEKNEIRFATKAESGWLEEILVQTDRRPEEEGML